MSPVRTAVAVGLLAAGCSTAEPPAPPAAAGAAALADATAPSTTTAPERVMVRDGDTTDVAELAARLAVGATGDGEWIDVFAELRARSWLANRYPGVYDLTEIYEDRFAEETAGALERESLDLGVYLDEPLPVLVSVSRTREIGQLTELDVVLESGEAIIRRSTDDVAVGRLPGGRQRGLFTVGERDGGAGWRIHSVVELNLIEPATAGEADS